MRLNAIAGMGLGGLCSGLLVVAGPWSSAQARDPRAAPSAAGRTARELYLAACAACHGADGTGAPRAQVGFSTPLPDFTDCSFATREPDSDWFAVTHDGGPARAFSPLMPAFGEALTDAEIQQTLDYLRTFCDDDGWPRGELNLPRAMFTEKAYPEDEVVVTTGLRVDEPRAVGNELLYETRFGDRYAVELVVPFSFTDTGPGGDGWIGGLEDVAIGVKAALFHSLETGAIFGLNGEVVLPTGDEDEGFGSGVTVFEPFLTYGQLLPRVGFLQLQAGLELPAEPAQKDREAFWRGAYGYTFTSGRFGRSWTPMLEVLGARALVDAAETEWDLVPQLHVSLSTRQHIQANLAVRVPMTQTEERSVEVLLFVLWDWFDGGLTQGW